MFSAAVEGLAEFEEGFRKKLQLVLADSVNRAAKAATQFAKDSHPYKDRTGELTKSLRYRMVQQTPKYAAAWILATKKYASYVEYGTGPHMIRPRAAHSFTGPLRESQTRARTRAGAPRKMLRWFDSAGDPVFANSVRHPGSKPYPYLAPAGVEFERLVVTYIEAASFD